MERANRRRRSRTVDISKLIEIKPYRTVVNCDYDFYVESGNNPTDLCVCGTDMCCMLHIGDYGGGEEVNVVD